MNYFVYLPLQLFICVIQCNCNLLSASNIVDSHLYIYNEELRAYNHISAELAWNFSTNLNQSEEFLAKTQDLLLKKNLWNNEWCLNLVNDQQYLRTLDLDVSKQRQIYLICRGPRYSSYQLSNILTILGNLRTTYDTMKICLESNCYRMEPDLNNLMENTRNEPLLKNAWILWHKTIGNELAPSYIELVNLMNLGAKQAGHSDIGSLWRDEMEDSNLVKNSLDLYADVKYLFSLLHTYVRFKLGEYYKLDLDGKPIPAHLLGNMWSQRWDSLIDLVWPEEEHSKSSFIEKHISKNAIVMDMVHWAENYYIDMGFPKLPTNFYENSYFENKNGSASNKNCHGSAANMYAAEKNNFRIMLCAKVKDTDLQTIVHEMGHIHYFMAYRNQPTIFQDGANSGFHEAVGDAVTYGMWTTPSLRTLLKIALAKLPQISFGLIVDLWRWKIFEAESNPKMWNDYWWKLNYEFLGVVPPEGYTTDGLDALGKYHIVDNIPYIRYYYASFLQHMFYDEMCKNQPYCSLKGKGKQFRKMLSKGTSQHWSRILSEFTGKTKVSAIPLLKYFKPLQNHLEREVVLHNLSLDW